MNPLIPNFISYLSSLVYKVKRDRKRSRGIEVEKEREAVSAIHHL